MKNLSGDWLLREPGVRDFGACYLEHFEALSAALEAQATHHPVLGAVILAMSREQREAMRNESKALLQEALGGNWEAYAARLRRDGETYAAMGLAMRDWYDLVTAWSRHLLPHLVHKLSATQERLTMALGTMQAFLDAAMAELNESYLKASQEQVRRREAELKRWETLFLCVPWGICVTDGEHLQIDLVNDAFSRVYGLDAAAMRGRTLASLYDPDDLERVRFVYAQQIRETGQGSFESIHVKADGSRFPVQVDVARVPLPGGRDSWALNVRDLTERKQIEALQARSSELETENRRIQEASRLKSEFLANMSHELRTPLNSILGFSELLKEGEVGPLAEQQLDFVSDIHTSGKHLLRLINDVLDLSKVEAGKLEFFPEKTSLRALCQEVLGVLRSVAKNKSISPDLSLQGPIDEVHLDPSRFKQVLFNYLSNAIKFSPQSGKVLVSIKAEGPSSFRLEVSDEGPGILDDLKPRLFMAFEQLDPGRAKTHGGTGLGLALTRRLVEAQGGAVGVRNGSVNGSVFWAILPLFSPSRSSLPQPRRILGARQDAPKVLVIEDNFADQERIVGLLMDAGYAVDTASTGAQALQLVGEHSYDAITLDLVLPDTSGLLLLPALKKLHRSREALAPVVVISQFSEQPPSGLVVHDVLRKPFLPEDLVSSLRKAGVNPPSAGAILVVDDDEPSSRLMAASLAQLGFRAHIARDGQQALEFCKQERPEAVVLDLVMPQLDGFAFLQQFRAEQQWSSVPVLVWTMKDLDASEHQILLQEVSAVLQKDGRGARALADLLRAYLPRKNRELV